MSATDWPRGCLGFAVNLARPVHKARGRCRRAGPQRTRGFSCGCFLVVGMQSCLASVQPHVPTPSLLQGHRASVLYSMLGQMLVFETLRDAEEYKEFLSQANRAAGPAAHAWCAGRLWLPHQLASFDGSRVLGRNAAASPILLCPALPPAEAALRLLHLPLPGRRPHRLQRYCQRRLLPGGACSLWTGAQRWWHCMPLTACHGDVDLASAIGTSLPLCPRCRLWSVPTSGLAPAACWARCGSWAGLGWARVAAAASMDSGRCF